MQNHNIRKTWDFFTWAETAVDQDSAAAQPNLYVADPTVFEAGQAIVIDPDASGGGLENKVILSIESDHVVLTTNLTNLHTAVQADVVFRQGQYQDVQQGGVVDDLQAEVWACKHKRVLITLANITDANGFTYTITGKILGLEFAIATDTPNLAADNGTTAIDIDDLYDDIKVEVSSWADGDITVTGLGIAGQ